MKSFSLEEKGIPSGSEPSLKDLAANIENQHTDAVMGESAVLERFYGCV